MNWTFIAAASIGLAATGMATFGMGYWWVGDRAIGVYEPSADPSRGSRIRRHLNGANPRHRASTESSPTTSATNGLLERLAVERQRLQAIAAGLRHQRVMASSNFESDAQIAEQHTKARIHDAAEQISRVTDEAEKQRLVQAYVALTRELPGDQGAEYLQDLNRIAGMPALEPDPVACDVLWGAIATRPYDTKTEGLLSEYVQMVQQLTDDDTRLEHLARLSSYLAARVNDR